jgi:hypothetical protein
VLQAIFYLYYLSAFTRVDIFAKSPYWLHLSVRPHVSAQLSLYRIFEILYCRLLRKSVEEIQICLKFDKNIGFFIWRPYNIHIFPIQWKKRIINYGHDLLARSLGRARRLLATSCPSVRSSVRISAAPNGRIFVNIGLGTLKKICRGICVKAQVCLILSSAAYVAQQYRTHFCTSITKL